MTAHSNARPQFLGREGRIITQVTVVEVIDLPNGVDLMVEDSSGKKYWIAESDIEWEVESNGTDQTSSRTTEINDQGE